MAIGGRYYCYREVVPFAAMVTVEFSNMGMNTLYKAAVTKGLSFNVYMVYSYAISALVLLPLSYFFHRNTRLPPLTIVQLCKFFILGFLGFMVQYLANRGILYSNTTLGSAMSNIVPALTFFLAVLFRMEKIKLRSVSSQSKIIGTLVSVTGALVIVLYNGPVLITSAQENAQLRSYLNVLRTTSSESNWIMGGALLAAGYTSAAVWYIFQAKYVNEYPAEFVLVFFYNLSAFIVAVPVCLVSVPDWNSWKVPTDVRLVSILYSGTMGSAFGILVHTWGLHMKGPVYVALFRPLSIAITAIAGVIFLHDNLYLGSVIGSIVISMGFYTMLWGKAKEETSGISNNDYSVESSNDAIVPFLKHDDSITQNAAP